MSASPPGNLRRLIRQTLTIARRDFVATVFTPMFLVFLFTPVLMLSFGLIGGMGASSVTSASVEKASIVAIVDPAQQRRCAPPTRACASSTPGTIGRPRWSCRPRRTTRPARRISHSATGAAMRPRPCTAS